MSVFFLKTYSMKRKVYKANKTRKKNTLTSRWFSRRVVRDPSGGRVHTGSDRPSSLRSISKAPGLRISHSSCMLGLEISRKRQSVHAGYRQGPQMDVTERFFKGAVVSLFIANRTSPTNTIEITSKKIDMFPKNGGADRWECVERNAAWLGKCFATMYGHHCERCFSI